MEVVDYDRMFTYLWWEKSNPNEVKFGERWVFAGQDPAVEVRKRVKESLGVRKDLINDGSVIIDSIWDVTDLAKKVNRYYKASRVDDFLREKIGFRKGSTGEIHKLSAPDMKLRVNKLLSKLGQPLIEAGLSTKQYEVAEEVLDSYSKGNRVVLAELCARFGKTIWSGAVAVEQGSDLIIIASYVKTVFTSFATDLTSFNQFSDYEHVDTGSDDYQDQITVALESGKKVFAYLSLANGKKRQDRIDFLFNQKVNKMLIVDEADFGAHQPKQANPLVDAIDETVHTIIMTGTNADRAATCWPVDTIVSVTYPELLMQKKETQDAQKV